MHWHIKSKEDYLKAYEESLAAPDKFWGGIAETFFWKKSWSKVSEGSFSGLDVKWFTGGELNITENCLDRYLETQPNKRAIVFEPNDPTDKVITYTYKELHEAVCKASNMLKGLGVKKGDRVCLYMAMVPELLISVLACARIGAIHSVVFGGFSAKALSDRINDATCKILITNDGGMRGNKLIPLKEISDNALKNCPSIEKVIVHKRAENNINMIEGRDLWWHENFKSQSDVCPAEVMNSEDPLFILYTSGSTGKPKGVLHTTAGYMIWAAYTFKNVFQVGEDDLYWCTADIGWITGHTYITYGPLLNGATTVMFEGVPTYPDAGRFWDVVDKHKITHFYTAPTAIRALQGFSLDYVTQKSLSSLKVLGSVGEPINEEAWQWYNKYIGKEKAPIVDTWWQTETGGIMISTLAGITEVEPCYATRPLPGIELVLMDEKAEPLVGNNVSGNLCVKKPWPGMARTVYGDHERYGQVYFSAYKDHYFTGDGCKRNENGLYRITGRVDDVINVSGHRIGTAEVEDAINQNIHIIESAVVGFSHEIKGQGIYAYVICDAETKEVEEIRSSVLKTVSEQIGAIAKPDKIQIVPALPKTRSGKIMRRILRKIANGDTSDFGDTSTLLDPSVVDAIKTGAL